MATRLHSALAKPGHGDDVRIIQWSGLLNGGDGEVIWTPAHRDLTVHVFGTFGAGGSVTIEGSNEIVASPTSQLALNDSRGEGNPLTFTSADIRQCLEAPVRIRPRVTAGDGTTSLTVILAARSGR